MSRALIRFYDRHSLAINMSFLLSILFLFTLYPPDILAKGVPDVKDMQKDTTGYIQDIVLFLALFVSAIGLIVISYLLIKKIIDIVDERSAADWGSLIILALAGAAVLVLVMYLLGKVSSIF